MKRRWRRALAAWLEEEEDYRLAVSRLEENLPSIPMREVARLLGLDD